MKTPCKYPGCNALVEGGGYCQKHQPEVKIETIYRKTYDKGRRASVKELADAAKFRNTVLWRKVRRIKLSINPLCEDPFGTHASASCTVTATQVHHIVGLAECANDERAYSLYNLMSVCTKCHARLEYQERSKKINL